MSPRPRTKPRNIRCTHTTAKGQPCKAWAVKGSDPPTCAAHAGLTSACPEPRRRAGAPAANQNARTHGFYARTLSPEEMGDLVFDAADVTLDDEIACARIALRRALEFIQQDSEALDREQYLRAAALIFSGTRTIARLLRDRHALSAESAGEIADFINQALDELSLEWGREL